MTDSAPDATAGETAVDAAETGGGRGLERLVFFSDAVFAIALTLLALELPVPEGDSTAALWHSFTSHVNRDYLTFLISFLVIARFWQVHHGYFGRVEKVDSRLIQLNLWYLLWIVVLPFATRVLGDTGQYAFGTVFYAIAVALVGISFAGLAWHCARAGLLRSAGTRGAVAGPVSGSLGVAAVFLVSIPVAFASPDGAKYCWLLLLPVGWITSALARRRAG